MLKWAEELMLVIIQGWCGWRTGHQDCVINTEISVRSHRIYVRCLKCGLESGGLEQEVKEKSHA